MSCPYFQPLSALEWPSWRAPLRPPLGAPYTGLCHAGGEPFQPGVETLLENCNMGYASGRCPCFRPGSGDAVRFAIARGEDRPPTVLWLVEFAGLPVLCGELLLTAVEAGAEPRGAPPHLAAQLRAYVASYTASLRNR